MNVVDICVGAGGLSLGLRSAGFTPVLAVDLDPASVETCSVNLGDHGLIADVSLLDAISVREAAGIGDSDLDLLAGGPPCQGFSKQKRGAHLGDRRNKLVLEFLRLVDELRPKAFLLENVPMMAQVRGRDLVEQFFHLDDYEMTGHYYVAADYGVAQTRERFVLAGVREDVEGSFSIPEPTTPDWLTVRDAIGDLPEPPTDGTSHPDFLNHYVTRPSALNVERFSHVPEGGGWQDIPFNLRLPCHQKANTSKGGWPDVYGRLEWLGQCPTVTGGFDSFTRGRYGHPSSDRAITPREAARLQGFPDDFEFVGNRYEVRTQIGNAVPPPLASAIGSSVRDALEGTTPKKTSFKQQVLI